MVVVGESDCFRRQRRSDAVSQNCRRSMVRYGQRRSGQRAHPVVVAALRAGRRFAGRVWFNVQLIEKAIGFLVGVVSFFVNDVDRRRSGAQI